MVNCIVVYDPETMGDEVEELKRLQEEIRKRTNHLLFHQLWTKAVGTKDYVKDEWKELARRFGV